MLATKQNFNTIATKFSEAMKSVSKDNIPYYIDLWKENNVEAIRLSATGDTSYSITIEGEEICRVELLLGHDQVLHEPIHVITEKLIKGARKYIESSIRSEVGSILDTIRDHRFTTSLFTGGLYGTVTTVETKNGSMKFIDIYQNNKLAYSAPHSSGYEDALTEVLLKVLKDTYLTNGMSITIP
jgi:hypothetical protein